jgi:hypothetical protein
VLFNHRVARWNDHRTVTENTDNDNRFFKHFIEFSQRFIDYRTFFSATE